MTTTSTINNGTNFEVYVAKETFKFHAAHFVAFKGFRERLHGHNYRVGVRVLGSRGISHDGYLIDFGDIKDAVKRICKNLNEHFLCPTLSDVIDITIDDDDGADGDGGDKDDPRQASVTLRCEDGAKFLFPKSDCALLPIVHATTEELSIYLWSCILEALDGAYLRQRGVHTMEVTVTEAPGQESVFRLGLPDDVENFKALDVKSFIMEGKIRPAAPCASAPGFDAAKAPAAVATTTSGGASTSTSATTTTNGCDGADGCASCQNSLSAQLEKLAAAINSQTMAMPTSEDGKTVSIDVLKDAIKKL